MTPSSFAAAHPFDPRWHHARKRPVVLSQGPIHTARRFVMRFVIAFLLIGGMAFGQAPNPQPNPAPAKPVVQHARGFVPPKNLAVLKAASRARHAARLKALPKVTAPSFMCPF